MMGTKRKIFFLSIHLLVLLILLLFFFSCGSKKAKPEPKWVYKLQSIQISYDGNKMLNEFNGASHALQVVIYQFDNINKFVELAAYEDGLKKLLKAQNFDPSVQAIKKIYVDPGQKDKLVMDRAEKSRWIGIVAGYFGLTPGKVTCFFEIPHKVEKQGIYFFRKEVAVIQDPRINLLLNEYSMTGKLLNE
ncbi:MAG: type VI secretion system lipoprotein TssJ [Desulfobacteraceae bacterium]|nr:type VI secretion system lipoprotein TssJ [Desulfobacteraceae bacterium]